MTMDLREIRYFLAVARELNFTRAAQQCGVSQPALTRSIQKLEAEVGGALFVRRPGLVALTRLGRELLPRFEEIGRNLETVRQTASDLAEGAALSLRLGVMCTVAPERIVEGLSRLRLKVPDARVSIVEATARKIVDLVASDEVDIGIAALPTYPDTIAASRLYEERYVVAMHPDDPLATGNAVPLGALEGCSYLERLSCEFDTYFEARHGAWPVELDVCFASEREDWIQALIRAGEGCAIVPESLALAPGIVTRPLAEPEVTREVSLLTLRGRPLPDLAQTFMRIAAHLAWAQPH
ncbi:MAG: LysR family transcriptional regulator [Hyphomicrobiaceae bacterium]|nr:LysR family transcriptional regulator [Hyphomicrobiaceae bacterium]